MKITILDGNALNPGDLSWDCLKKYGQVTVYQQTAPESVIERIGDSDAVFLNKIVINSKILSACPNLKYIGVLATGYNVIDTQAVKQAGIVATNIPSYSTMAVSQHTFALILHFANHVALHNESVQKGDWKKAPSFCYWNAPLTELDGKTLGILGYGNIGKQVEKIANAFGMQTLICPHHPSSSIQNCVSQEELWAKSDFITLHAPLTPETKEIINKNSISQMKDGVYIINTARGGLVNETAVKQGLVSGKIAGYGADVLLEEPMSQNCQLFNVKNAVLTPHIAWATKEARIRLLQVATDNVQSFLSGNPINVVM